MPTRQDNYPVEVGPVLLPRVLLCDLVERGPSRA